MYINFLNVLTPKLSVIHKNNHICKLQYTHLGRHLKIFGSRYLTFPYSPEQQSIACDNYWNDCCYYGSKCFGFLRAVKMKPLKFGRIRMK